MIVNLNHIDGLPLCLLVEHSSGVVWHNQVGGTGTVPQQLEGILVPLPLTDTFGAALLDFIEDPLTDFGPHANDPVPVAVRIEGWLRWARLETLFEPRDDAYVYEAWVPVRVKDDLGYAAEYLGPFRGRRAVLTYQNSD
jgi:hypothetical protein